jgi:hypothetical protein
VSESALTHTDDLDRIFGSPPPNCVTQINPIVCEIAPYL